MYCINLFYFEINIEGMRENIGFTAHVNICSYYFTFFCLILELFRTVLLLSPSQFKTLLFDWQTDFFLNEQIFKIKKKIELLISKSLDRCLVIDGF